MPLSAMHWPRGSSDGLRSTNRPNENLCGDSKLVVQSANHIDRQAALAIEHLRDTGPSTQDLFQVFACQPLLFHPKLDRLDWVRRVHRIVLGLVGLDESRKDVEAVAFGRAGLCAPELFDLCERVLVVPFTPDRS